MPSASPRLHISFQHPKKEEEKNEGDSGDRSAVTRYNANKQPTNQPIGEHCVALPGLFVSDVVRVRVRTVGNQQHDVPPTPWPH